MGEYEVEPLYWSPLPLHPALRSFYRNVRWQPAKPRTRIKIVECGPGHWDEQDHRLDYPGPIDTTDFRVTGTGHERIEKTYKEGCANCRQIVGFNEKQPEHRIAAWLCRHACSFVLFDTKARSTVIGFEREDDAAAFRRAFIRSNAQAT